MTQEQLADLLNVSKRSVQDYEAGVTIPWKHFQAMEGIFKKPMAWFLHGELSPAQEGPTQVADAEIAEALVRIEQLLETLAAQSAEGGPESPHASEGE